MLNPNNLRTVLLDMDGVLWKGDQPVVDLPDLFRSIDRAGWKVFCITNNSVRTIDSYLAKFSGFGVELHPEQIITSAEASAAFLVERFPDRGDILVVGEQGLVDTLSACGFSVAASTAGELEILAVVVGLDRQLTYQKIQEAANAIRTGALFLGTNPDRTLPLPSGIAPGAGTVISAVQAAAGQQPLIIGKPQPTMFELALTRSGSLPGQALMIGDRLDTDIQGAQAMGIRTALVLSGVTQENEASSWDPQPDLTADDIRSVLARLIENEH